MSALGQKRTSQYVRAMSALPPKADIGTQPRDVRFVPKADIAAGGLAEHPSAITDDLVARASGITGVAQRQTAGFQVATVRLEKKASDWEVATRLPWAQTGPVTIFSDVHPDFVSIRSRKNRSIISCQARRFCRLAPRGAT